MNGEEKEEKKTKNLNSLKKRKTIIRQKLLIIKASINQLEMRIKDIWKRSKMREREKKFEKK